MSEQTTPALRVEGLTRHFGSLRAVQDVSFQVRPGARHAVIGPNGAGKSTLLGVLSGLLRPEGSTVTIGDDVVVDLARRRPTWVPPHRRGVGVLSQDPLLFPHLTALENVAFGPRSRGASRSAARHAATEMLHRIGLDHLADRRPSQLSGGQAQRIALARALAARPRLLLLDEPLSALDVDAKPEVRQTLLELLPGLTTVIVTHDVLDAVLLADRVAVVDHGRVVESGPARQVLSTPRSTFAARLAGLNIIDGTWTGEALQRVDGPSIVVAPAPDLAAGARCRAVFRPTAVSVHTSTPGGSPRNVLEVTVTGLEPHADLVRVRAGALSADITPASAVGLGLRPGGSAHFVVKATEVTVFPL